MELKKAVEILSNYTTIDRIMRDYNVETEYEQFCEERCLAIEVVLKELEKERCKCPSR